jgi:hypothetical protein
MKSKVAHLCLSPPSLSFSIQLNKPGTYKRLKHKGIATKVPHESIHEYFCNIGMRSSCLIGKPETVKTDD